mgnify:CR=1 FL=1
MTWTSDIFLHKRIGHVFCWSRRISFIATLCILLVAIMGYPSFHSFIAALLATVTSEFLYQVYQFKTQQHVSTSDNCGQCSEVSIKTRKDGCL